MAKTIYKIGQRVVVPLSGWTGSVIRVLGLEGLGSGIHYRVLWDQTRKTSLVHPMNLVAIEKEPRGDSNES